MSKPIKSADVALGTRDSEPTAAGPRFIWMPPTAPTALDTAAIDPQSLLQGMDAAAIIADPRHRIIAWSQGAEMVYGWTAAEAIGQLAPTLLQDASQASSWLAAAERVKHGERWQGSLAQRHRDGRTIAVQLSLSELYDSSGAPCGTLMLAQLEHKDQALQRSEARFATAFAASPTAQAITRVRDRHFVDVNASLLRLGGFEREELIGHDALTVGFILEPARLVEIGRTLRDTGSYAGDLEVRTKAGELRLVKVTAVAIELAGEPCFLIQVDDLTEQRLAEQALRESEERFRLLAEGAQDYAIFVLDPVGRVMTWNAGAERIKGYTAAEIMGQHLSQFYPAPDRARGWPDQLLHTAAATGHVLDEGWRVRRDGSQFWGSVVITALRGADGALRGFSKLTRDITAQKQAERRLQRANRALELVTECTQHIVHAATEAELLQGVCQRIVAVGGYQLAWVGQVEAGPDWRVRPVAHAGGAPADVAQRIAAWDTAAADAEPTGTAVRTGRPAIAHDIRHAPATAPADEVRMAAAALPLIVDGQTMGALTIYAAESDAFDASETALLTELSGDLAFGIHALRTRAAQERAETRLRVLADASHAFATAGVAFQPLLNRIAQLTAEQLRAATSIRLLSDDAQGLDVCAFGHYDPQVLTLMQSTVRELRMPLDYPTPAAIAARTGQPSSVSERDPDALHAALPPVRPAILDRFRPHSILGVPLRVHDETIGSLAFSRADKTMPAFAAEDVELAQDLADRAAMAIHDARLFAQAQRELAERQRAEQALQRTTRRLTTLAQVSRALAETQLAVPAILDVVVRQCATLLGDDCSVRLLADDGITLLPGIGAHRDPGSEALLAPLVATPPAPEIAERLHAALSAGAPLLRTDIDLGELPVQLTGEVRAAIEHYAPHSLLVVPLRHSGRTLGVLVAARSATPEPYTDDDMALMQEVAERTVLALRAADLYRMALEAVRTRDVVLATASHDLRNPLVVVAGYVNLARRRVARGGPETSVALDDVLSRIETAVNQMDAQISELVDTARLEAGHRLQLQLQPTELRGLLQRVVAQYQDMTAVHFIHLANAPSDVQGVYDGPRLARVLGNLLTNAIKYSPAGGPITVTLATEHDGPERRVLIAVRDRGMGIPSADLPRIFDRFHRAGNVGAIAGTGLGLASARQIVEQHGGSLTVASTPGSGSTFTVALPWSPTA